MDTANEKKYCSGSNNSIQCIINVEKAAHYSISSASAIPRWHMCKQYSIVMYAFGQKNKRNETTATATTTTTKQEKQKIKKREKKRKQKSSYTYHIPSRIEFGNILSPRTLHKQQTHKTHTSTHINALALFSISFAHSAVCMGARHRLPLPSLPYSLAESRAYPHTEWMRVWIIDCVCLRVLLFFFTKTVPAAVARWCVCVCVHFFVLFVWYLLYAQK